MKGITNYIYELFRMKRMPHIGWSRAHVDQPDTLAEHVMLTMQIGYLLADLE